MADGKDPSLLGVLAGIYESLPFEYLLVGHCLLVASWFVRLKDKYILSYWVGALAALGGGIVSALLIQDPQRAPIPFFAVNSVGIIWTASWWLINYFPGATVARLVDFLPVRLVTKACLNTLRASLIAARVDLAVDKYPGVVAAPLLIGTIAGTGGKFCVDPILSAVGELSGPNEFLVPGLTLRSGFVGAVVYWLCAHVYAVLTPMEAKALIISLYILHGTLSDLVGVPLDYTHHLAKLTHTVSNVPMPRHAELPELTGSVVQSKKDR